MKIIFRPDLRSGSCCRPRNLLWQMAAVGLLMFAALPGCETRIKPTTTSSGADKTDSAEEGPTALAGVRCDDILKSAMTMLRPESLGVTSGREEAVGLLNQWQEHCAPSSANYELSPQLTELLPAEIVNQVSAPRFGSRDGDHIRDSILAADTSKSLMKSATSDVERVLAAFNYTVRNIQLEKPASEPLPLRPFDVLLFGRGLTADRAWVFCDMLHQLNIDAVVLVPGGEAAQAAENNGRLVGVLLGDDVYLFDMLLGLPVPAESVTASEAFITQPASLEEIVAKPELLKGLSVSDDEPYWVTVDELKAAEVRVCGNPTLWAPRMEILQGSVTGPNSAVIYQNLDGENGLVSRITSVDDHRWKEDQIAIWDYPVRMLEGYENLTPEQQQRLDDRRYVFRAPLPVASIDDKLKSVVFGDTEYRLLKTRMSQVTGDYESATRSYLTIRLDCQFPPSYRFDEKHMQMHAQAVDDATFWGAICQYEQGDVQSAGDSFQAYLNRFAPLGGRWVDAAQGLYATTLAERGRLAQAVFIAKDISEGNPQKARYELLVSRWRAAQQAQSENDQAAASN